MACQKWIGQELNAPGRITYREEEGRDEQGNKVIAAAQFYLDDEYVGILVPSDIDKSSADCCYEKTKQ